MDERLIPLFESSIGFPVLLF